VLEVLEHPRRVATYAILKELNYRGLVVPVGAGARPRYDLAARVLPVTGTVARDARGQAVFVARAELLRRYFRAYGPATPADFVWWSGLTVAEARAVVEGARKGLEEARLAGCRAPAYRYPGTARSAGPPMALLGPFEPLLLAYRDRRRFLDPAWRKRVVSRAGVVAPVVLHRGRVVTTWKAARRAGGLVVTADSFGTPGWSGEEMADAAGRLAEHYGVRLGAVRWT